MAVFIDNGKYPYRRMLMCHMGADTLEELHAMAERLGIRVKWFQGHTRIPHYDICQSKRHLAILYGAIPVTQKEFVCLMTGRKSKYVRSREEILNAPCTGTPRHART